MALFFVVLAVGAGSLIPVQAGVNASLRSVLGSPVLATISNFVVGLSLLAGYAAASRLRLPTLSHLAAAPWWYWLGGSMGVLLVLSGVVLSHRLGATTFVACIILGQLAASIVIDHFGWIGFSQSSISVQRIAGLVFLVTGVALIHRS
jgi:transporter family-2 protein